jgi:hypothetical protein
MFYIILKGYNLMKKLIATALLLPVVAHALVTFKDGDVATAADFNSNFEELESKLDAPSNDFNPNGFANGMPAEINVYELGEYYILLEDGYPIRINADGFASPDTFYYAAEDCSGQPYINAYGLNKDKPIGEEWSSPNIEPSKEYLHDGQNGYYGQSPELYLVHAKSTGHSISCMNAVRDVVASRPIPAVLDITFPIKITGIGVPMKILEEIGVAPEVAP